MALAFTYAHKKAFSEMFSKTNAHKYGYAWKHDGICMLWNGVDFNALILEGLYECYGKNRNQIAERNI